MFGRMFIPICCICGIDWLLLQHTWRPQAAGWGECLTLGCHADVTQDRAGELREEALDEVEPRPHAWVAKVNSNRPSGWAESHAFVPLGRNDYRGSPGGYGSAVRTRMANALGSSVPKPSIRRMVGRLLLQRSRQWRQRRAHHDGSHTI
jgi:hypothetical protein